MVELQHRSNTFVASPNLHSFDTAEIYLRRKLAAGGRASARLSSHHRVRLSIQLSTQQVDRTGEACVYFGRVITDRHATANQRIQSGASGRPNTHSLANKGEEEQKQRKMSGYYRTGRGGAGNFKSAQEIKKVRLIKGSKEMERGKEAHGIRLSWQLGSIVVHILTY